MPFTPFIKALYFLGDLWRYPIEPTSFPDTYFDSELKPTWPVLRYCRSSTWRGHFRFLQSVDNVSISFMACFYLVSYSQHGYIRAKSLTLQKGSTCRNHTSCHQANLAWQFLEIAMTILIVLNLYFAKNGCFDIQTCLLCWCTAVRPPALLGCMHIALHKSGCCIRRQHQKTRNSATSKLLKFWIGTQS